LDPSAPGFTPSGTPAARVSRTRVLTRRDVASVMSLQDYMSAVESGFRAYAIGDANVPLPSHVAGKDGVFHAKAAQLTLDRAYVAIKVNGNFPGNPARNGLPTIQGVVLLCDASDGTVLALMDSIEITLRRTAAATAIAARHLASSRAETVAVCGCGVQGRAQLEALVQVMTVRRVLVWDADAGRSRQFADEMGRALQLPTRAVDDPRDATHGSHVIVTATTARVPFLTRDMVSPGAFVAAVGADSPEKSELAPDLMAGATIVVDLIAQAITMGDLHHAVKAGVVTANDVHAELAEIVVGRKRGRMRETETIVFDSTGTAIQDAASAAVIWQRAVARNVGTCIEFGAP
jgi:alanine dehydrogenase